MGYYSLSKRNRRPTKTVAPQQTQPAAPADDAGMVRILDPPEQHDEAGATSQTAASTRKVEALISPSPVLPGEGWGEGFPPRQLSVYSVIAPGFSKLLLPALKRNTLSGRSTTMRRGHL